MLWSWSLDDGQYARSDAEEVLADEERVQSRRFVTPQLQRRFVAARAGLRSILGLHLQRDPRRLDFVRSEFGKPVLTGSPTAHFNLSHSGGRAILAISRDVEVGCDLEQVRPIDHLELARRYFHAAEVVAIEGTPDVAAQALTFFRIWTLKESFVKALGIGLSIALDRFAVSIAEPSPTLVLRPPGTAAAWWLHQAVLPDGYCRALAAPFDGEVELILRTV
jgi:4'-phosphopantetheinyl transferase